MRGRKKVELGFSIDEIDLPEPAMTEEGPEMLKPVKPLPLVNREALPKSAVYGKKKGRLPKHLSLTSRIREVLGAKAMHVEMVRKYCEEAGLNPAQTTVRDAIIHCQLYWALRGSPAHMQAIWERVDGKVAVKAEIDVSGKMGISEALSAMQLAQRKGGNDEEDEGSRDA